MVDMKAIGLVAVALAAWPAVAPAQNAGEAEQTATRLREADRLERQGMASARGGYFASAVVPLEAALMIRDKALGADHADTLRSVDELAMTFLALERPEAEPLLKRVLAAREKALGPDHPGVADGLHNLANAYAASDDPRRIEESLPLFERAAAIRAGALGPEHPLVAETLNRLAIVDMTLARLAGSRRMPDVLAPVRPTPAFMARPKLSREAYLARAEREHRQALAIREKALGAEHPAVAASLQGLAAVLVERGQYAQAEPLLKRSLAITEKAAGPEHPATAAALDHYADALTNVRRDRASLAEAKALKARARAILDAQVRRASADAPPSIAPAR